MANKNIISILIEAKNNVSKAFKEAGKDTTTFQKTINSLKTAFVGIGAAFAAREVFEFGSAARDASLSAEAARNKLTLAAGGAKEYEETITAAKEATRGMVSEADLANGAFVLLEMNLASNAQEAAKLANAGQILSKAFESQGASVELFNRLLANGSVVLLDNFGISQSQVKIRQAQIEATSDLSEQEARLTAIRELAIEKSERLASTMTDEQIAADNATASYQDMLAALGDLIVAQERAMDATGTTASFYDAITGSLKGWGNALQFAAIRNDLAARATARLGRELTLEEHMMLESGKATGELAAVLEELIAETDAASEAQRRGAGTLDSYRQMAALTAQEIDLNLNRALDAQTARWQGLANAQRTMAGGEAILETLAGGSTFNQQEAADFAQAQKDKEEAAKEAASAYQSAFQTAADNIASSISGAVNEAFGRINETVDLPGMEGEDPGEFGRRLGALVDGVQDSDQAFLERFKEQAGGSPIFAALLQSLEEGDQAGVAAEANRLLQNNMANVLAVGLADSIKAQMAQQDIMAEAQQLVADQLGQVESKVVDIGTAAGEMRTETTGATDEIITATENVITLTQEWDKILGGISGKYEDIAKNANNLNPAAQNGAGTSNATNEQLNR